MKKHHGTCQLIMEKYYKICKSVMRKSIVQLVSWHGEKWQNFQPDLSEKNCEYHQYVARKNREICQSTAE